MLLKDTNNEIAFIKSNLGRYFSEEEIREFLEYEDRITISKNNKMKEIHQRKFNTLIN